MNTPYHFEINGTFCSNPHCILHVTIDSPNVRGEAGNWALLPNGITVGRLPVAGRYYCDLCIRDQAIAAAGG